MDRVRERYTVSETVYETNKKIDSQRDKLFYYYYYYFKLYIKTFKAGMYDRIAVCIQGQATQVCNPRGLSARPAETDQSIKRIDPGSRRLQYNTTQCHLTGESAP